MPRVSVVVPVYKVEKYIHRCIESILAQTFTDFELILVDDGSPDNCGKICDEYAAKDSRIVVIHQENIGAAAARNRGMDRVKGEYLAFCDSDDVVGSMWLERMLKYAECGTYVLGSYCQNTQQLGIQKPLDVPTQVPLDKSRYFDFNCAGIAGYLCNSLYDVRVIQVNNLKIREKKEQGDYNEDLLFNLQYVEHMNKVLYTGYADYCYDTHTDSLSRSYEQFYFPKYEEKFWLWHNFVQKYCTNSGEILTNLSDIMMYHFLTAMQQFSKKNGYKNFRKMVESSAVAKCLEYSTCSKENPRVIGFLKKHAFFRLWLLLKFSK